MVQTEVAVSGHVGLWMSSDAGGLQQVLSISGRHGHQADCMRKPAYFIAAMMKGHT